MSLFVQAFALLPTIVAVIVVIAAIADRREGDALSELSALDHASSADDAERDAASFAA